MKPIQKHIILIIGLSLLLLLGYIGIQDNSSSQLDGLTNTNTDLHTNSHINTGANNTPKPSPTLSVDTNIWGGNPFQTGSTSTGALTKPETPKPQTTKVVFQKPNTEWKSRTLSGITYVFGEGNPKEVALSVETMQQELRECEITPGSMARICREGMYGYVTPEIEQALRQVLESPLWNEYLSSCSSEYRESSRFDEYIIHRKGLDINTLIFIDQNTGRKELDLYSTNDALGSVVTDLTLYTGYRPCAEKHGGKTLFQMLENIKALYTTTVAHVNQNNRFPAPSEISQSLNN